MQHGQAIDAAHSRLRDHDGRLAELTVQSNHALERLSRVEAATGEQHRLLVTLDGTVAGIGRQVADVAATASSTHALLATPIDANLAANERQTKRAVRLWGLFAGALILLLLIHAALTEQSPLAVVTGWLG
jgi:hypothetical protein